MSYETVWYEIKIRLKFEALETFVFDQKGQSYNTFYGRNLQIFVIS